MTFVPEADNDRLSIADMTSPSMLNLCRVNLMELGKGYGPADTEAVLRTFLLLDVGQCGLGIEDAQDLFNDLTRAGGWVMAAAVRQHRGEVHTGYPEDFALHAPQCRDNYLIKRVKQQGYVAVGDDLTGLRSDGSEDGHDRRVIAMPFGGRRTFLRYGQSIIGLAQKPDMTALIANEVSAVRDEQFGGFACSLAEDVVRRVLASEAFYAANRQLKGWAFRSVARRFE